MRSWLEGTVDKAQSDVQERGAIIGSHLYVMASFYVK